jgi:hypothetical protein
VELFIVGLPQFSPKIILIHNSIWEENSNEFLLSCGDSEKITLFHYVLQAFL